MRKGMTGFGRAHAECNGLMVRVEMKSVNQRFLDVNLRLPEGYRHLDPDIRQRLSAQMARGKVDLWLEVKTLVQKGQATLNEEALQHWLEQLTNSKAASLLGKPLWHDLLALPDVMQSAEANAAADAQVLAVVQEALDALQQTRAREGEAI